MLTRRDFIRRLAGASLLATPAGTALLTPAACGSRASRPNVILILVDDHAHDALGYSGRYPFLETPNIDRLAAQGIQFRNSFVTTALCVPSRASLQTGCYVSRHGVTRNSTPKEPGFQFGRLPTLPDVLHDNDYDTAFIGKWHLGSGEPFRAFDYWASLRWQGNYNKNWLNVNGQGIFEEEYVTDLLTRYAVRWLLQDATDSPFFLMLSHKAVHSPFVPAPRHAGRFATASLPMPANYLDDLADKHPVTRQRTLYAGLTFRERRKLQNIPIPPSIVPKPWKTNDSDRLDYLRCILSVDESVGSVLDALDETGRADDTWVLLTSDQGFFMGEHQLFGKDLMYEAALRVPLLVRPPTGTAPARAVDEMVLNIDVAPTLIDLCGCPIPPSMQGAFFAPLLLGGEIPRPWRDAFFYEDVASEGRPTINGLRTTSWKLITYPGEDFEELYDLKNDPEELHNLAKDPGSAQTLAALRSQLAELRKAATDPAPAA